MRTIVHIGLPHTGAERVQATLVENHKSLLEEGILIAGATDPDWQDLLMMAVADPDHLSPRQATAARPDPSQPASLRKKLKEDLAAAADRHRPDTLILLCGLAGATLHRKAELERLKALLAPLSNDITIVAHVAEQARLLVRHYAAQILAGREIALDLELTLAARDNWWQACLDASPPTDPAHGRFFETQAAPFWLDYAGLLRVWEDVFGAGSMLLRPGDPGRVAPDGIVGELAAAFGINATIPPPERIDTAPQPSAAWLTRARLFNGLLRKAVADGRLRVAPQLWRQCTQSLTIPGDPISPGSLAALSDRFSALNADLATRFPALADPAMTPDAPGTPWVEADPRNGFRASQYLLAFLPRLEPADPGDTAPGAPDRMAADPSPRATVNDPLKLSPAAKELLPPKALSILHSMAGSPFVPHNDIGPADEDQSAPPYAPVARPALPPGSTGKVIVTSMKNEGPYILEWIAYHRAIGIDRFLIYTNDCDDGTDALLQRLQKLGLVEHRDNSTWSGNSPQQHALKRAVDDPVIRQADWIAHIDVDEFINVRTGNGTLDDFLAAVPGATNIAMTWRLFGHSGVTGLQDAFVIEQFDSCAPKFCPKPHTAWGFKTMFRNIGAYQKISCHRPNALDEARLEEVKWVNGSGQDITHEVALRGWRSSKKTIGYNLLQLNHYAVRSAESFLVKRQRGRGLHVDREIGLNYWIRMDWSHFRDVTILRNLPRLRREHDRLMADATLRRLHDAAVDWHKATIRALRAVDEFEELYRDVQKLKLTETERVALTGALDRDS